MLRRVSIPEEMIMSTLDLLLTGSEPGQEIQHLHTIAAPSGAVGPLGLADEGKLKVCVYAIVPDDTPAKTMAFIRQSIVAAAIQHREKNQDVLFAGLSHEFFCVEGGLGEVGRRAEVERLQRAGELHTHPDAVEMTSVYAACKDGRRWQGVRYLTGPKAGQTAGVDMFVGRVCAGEGFNLSTSPLVRRLAGLGF